MVRKSITDNRGFRIGILGTLLIMLFYALVLTPTFADQNRTNNEISVKKIGMDDAEGKNVVLPKGEVVDSNYFAAGKSVTLSGSVKGDAYLAAGTIDIEGTVEGDLIAIGGVVNIRGTVLDDVRLTGGQIIISGDIKGNLTVAGGSITLTDSAKVIGSLVSAGANIKIFGSIGDDAIIGAKNLTIGNRVGGNLKAGAGEIILTSNALIAGDFAYFSKSKAEIQEGAQVRGEMTHKIPTEKPQLFSPAQILSLGFLAYFVLSVLSALIVGLLLIRFYPNFVNQTVDIIKVKSLNSLGIGFLAVIIIPIICLILIFTVIGIPLGIIIMLSYLIYIYLTKIFVSLFIGRGFLQFFGSSPKSGWTLLVGLIIYVILTSIPFIGWILNIIFVFLGFGALLIYYKQIYKKLRSENVV